MDIHRGNPALSIAGNSYLTSVVPGANIHRLAFPRERFSVAWCAISFIVPTGNITALILGAISQLQRKMAVSSTVVVRRYNNSINRTQKAWWLFIPTLLRGAVYGWR